MHAAALSADFAAPSDAMSLDEYLTHLVLRAQHGLAGQGLVEYALIIALVAIILINSLSSLRAGIDNTFTTIRTAM